MKEYKIQVNKKYSFGKHYIKIGYNECAYITIANMHEKEIYANLDLPDIDKIINALNKCKKALQAANSK